MIYVLLWMVVISQRIIELFIAKSNENWMKNNGAKVIDEGHYLWIVVTHVSFLLCILIEAYFRHQLQNEIVQSLLFIFIVLQALRLWCQLSLGRFWNTKIIVIPNVAIIKKGPYRFIKHPNYIIVGLEFFVIPLLFQAYISAIVFPVLHIVLMYFRIPMEERALRNIKEE